jgi:hypothetical protein
VQVLVGGDAGEQPVADGVVAVAAGVAVGDPGGELLERDVGHHLEDVLVVAVVAVLHLRHAVALELHRVTPRVVSR